MPNIKEEPTIKKLRYKHGKKLFNREKKKGNIIQEKKAKTHKKKYKEYKSINSKYKTKKTNLINKKYKVVNKNIQTGGLKPKKFNKRVKAVEKITATNLFNKQKNNIKKTMPNINPNFKTLIYNYYNLISHIAIFRKFSDVNFSDGNIKANTKAINLLSKGISNDTTSGVNNIYNKFKFVDTYIDESIKSSDYFNICYSLNYMRNVNTKNNNFLNSCSSVSGRTARVLKNPFKIGFYKIKNLLINYSTIEDIKNKLGNNKFIFMCEYYKLMESYFKVNYYHHKFIKSLKLVLRDNSVNNEISFSLYNPDTGAKDNTSIIKTQTITEQFTVTKLDTKNINDYRYLRLKKINMKDRTINDKSSYNSIDEGLKGSIINLFESIKTNLLSNINNDTKTYLEKLLDSPRIINAKDIIVEYKPYDNQNKVFLNSIEQKSVKLSSKTSPSNKNPKRSSSSSSSSQNSSLKPTLQTLSSNNSKTKQDEVTENIKPRYMTTIRKTYHKLLENKVNKSKMGNTNDEYYKYKKTFTQMGKKHVKYLINDLTADNKTLFIIPFIQLMHHYLKNINKFYKIEDTVMLDKFLPRFLDINYSIEKFKDTDNEADIKTVTDRIHNMSRHIDNDINLLIQCLNHNTMKKDKIYEKVQNLKTEISILGTIINKLGEYSFMTLFNFQENIYPKLQVNNTFTQDEVKVLKKYLTNNISSIQHKNTNVQILIEILKRDTDNLDKQLKAITLQKGGDDNPLELPQPHYTELYKTIIDNETGSIVEGGKHKQQEQYKLLDANDTANKSIYYTRVKKEGITELYNDIIGMLNNPIFIKKISGGISTIIQRKGKQILKGSDEKEMYFNYIMKFLMGVIYYDNDIADSTNPLGDDLFKAKQNFPLLYENYLCQRFFDFKDINNEFINYNNIMLGHIIVNNNSNRETEFNDDTQYNDVKQFITKKPYEDDEKTQMFASKQKFMGDYPAEVRYFYNNSNFDEGTNLLIPQSFLRLNLLTPDELIILNDRSLLSQKLKLNKFVNKYLDKSNGIINFRFLKFIDDLWTTYHKKYKNEYNAEDNTNYNNKMKEYLTTIKKIILDVNNNWFKQTFIRTNIQQFNWKNAFGLFSLFKTTANIPFQLLGFLTFGAFNTDLDKTKDDIINEFINYYKNQTSNNIIKIYNITSDDFNNINNIKVKNINKEKNDVNNVVQIIKDLNTDIDILLDFRKIRISKLNRSISHKNISSQYFTQDFIDKIKTESTEEDDDNYYPELNNIVNFGEVIGDRKMGPGYIKTLIEYMKTNIIDKDDNKTKSNANYVKLCCIAIKYYFEEKKMNPRKYKTLGVTKQFSYNKEFKKLFTKNDDNNINPMYDSIKAIITSNGNDVFGTAIFNHGFDDNYDNYNNIKDIFSKSLTKKTMNQFDFMGITKYIKAIEYFIYNQVKLEQDLESKLKIEDERVNIKTINPENKNDFFGNTQVFEGILANNEFNGLDFTSMYMNASCTAPNLIQMYRNDLEKVLEDDFQDTNMDLKTKFDKVLTKIFIFLKLNGLLWDFALSFPERFKDMANLEEEEEEEEETDEKKVNAKIYEINVTDNKVQDNSVTYTPDKCISVNLKYNHSIDINPGMVINNSALSNINNNDNTLKPVDIKNLTITTIETTNTIENNKYYIILAINNNECPEDACNLNFVKKKIFSNCKEETIEPDKEQKQEMPIYICLYDYGNSSTIKKTKYDEKKLIKNVMIKKCDGDDPKANEFVNFENGIIYDYDVNNNKITLKEKGDKTLNIKGSIFSNHYYYVISVENKEIEEPQCSSEDDIKANLFLPAENTNSELETQLAEQATAPAAPPAPAAQPVAPPAPAEPPAPETENSKTETLKQEQTSTLTDAEKKQIGDMKLIYVKNLETLSSNRINEDAETYKEYKKDLQYTLLSTLSLNLESELLAKILKIKFNIKEANNTNEKLISLLDFITKGTSDSLSFRNNLLTKSQEHVVKTNAYYMYRNQRQENFLLNHGKTPILNLIEQLKTDYDKQTNILTMIHQLIDRYFLHFMSMEYRGFFLYLLVLLTDNKLNNKNFKANFKGINYSTIKEKTIGNLITTNNDIVYNLIELFFKVEIKGINANIVLKPESELEKVTILLKAKDPSNTNLKGKDVITRVIFKEINEFINTLSNEFNDFNNSTKEFNRLVYYKSSNMANTPTNNLTGGKKKVKRTKSKKYGLSKFNKKKTKLRLRNILNKKKHTKNT